MSNKFCPFSVVLVVCAVIEVECCPTHISIWPNGKTSFEATIQVRWDQNCDPKPNWIKFFEKDPAISNLFPKSAIEIHNDSSTDVVIDQRIGKLLFPGGWNRNDQLSLHSTKPKTYPRGRCLDYYVASFRDSDLLSVNCLKIQPNWMRLTEHIADIPLKSLFIPGTHASGCYYNITKKGSWKMEKFYHTQNYDVWTQLVFGVRFLDLSLGYFLSNTAKYSISTVYEDTLVNPIINILVDVRNFVRLSGEVVLLDFRDFLSGSRDNVQYYHVLISLLEIELGEFTFRRNTSSTHNQLYDFSLNDVIKAGKNILLMGSLEKLKEFDVETDLIWPSWKSFSTGNLNDSEILDQMRLIFSGRSNSPTYNEGFIFHFNRGQEAFPFVDKVSTTRERAISINYKIKDWLSGPWSLQANVVTADFIMSTNLIELALTTNRYKAYRFANEFVSFPVS
ncbi:unnamed protein product [Hermetia illucens]|uniref:Uncharacterized protein n=1 Tax=Hermetia illucens TaxID=343691 RepID=A0A7R8YQV2_HERIL|nr:uncharacterized protein LOC119648393 isoform X2 [Hermetia illucens]CAD7082251.1 unnamed protein product [Hermetia illucens]